MRIVNRRFILMLGLITATPAVYLLDMQRASAGNSIDGSALVPIVEPLVIEAGATSDEFDRGLLWRIDSGTSSPSYLFGTMHVEDTRINELPAPVMDAFNNSNSLTTEALLDVEQLLLVGTELLLTDGTTLEELIGPDLFVQVTQALETRGLLPQIAALLKPWAVAVLLSQPRTQSGMFLDRRLYELAQQRGKSVFGLETLSEQLQIFNAMSIDDQIVLLEETLTQIDTIPEIIEKLTQAYLERDLAKLTELANQQFSQSRAHARLKQGLLFDRNKKMMERMQPRISEGNAFFAVGALHLPGPDGLLSLLQRQGYALSRIY